ncbi:MAG: hypothetical protein P1U42_08485 [Phycisphaerales bacterium]|nr:hypothetical protein [Phycisphaerales bacterium]
MNRLTLWDLLIPTTSRKKPRRRKQSTPTVIVRTNSKRKSAPTGMQLKYEQITKQMLLEYGVRVRKWRSSMSGVAWQVTYRDGSVSKLLESPKPKGPMSAAIFLHEIGHHAIGFGTYKPRCLEEFYAWKFSIDKMHELELNVTDRVHERMHDSLNYAVEKALRRGLKKIPEELLPYVEPRVLRSA